MKLLYYYTKTDALSEMRKSERRRKRKSEEVEKWGKKEKREGGGDRAGERGEKERGRGRA